jgi:hypothetical protein
MTPTGKGIVLAALDILVETKTLIKRDYDEAKKVIEQISDNDFLISKQQEIEKCETDLDPKQ